MRASVSTDTGAPPVARGMRCGDRLRCRMSCWGPLVCLGKTGEALVGVGRPECSMGGANEAG